MHGTHADLRHIMVRDARLVRRSLPEFAFPINPKARRGLVGALVVSILLVWGAWVPARSQTAVAQGDPPAHVQALR